MFHTERSRSTPLDPKLMFWCVSFCLGAFGIVSLLHETRCKTRHTVAINAKVSVPKSCQNFFAMNAPDPHHWTLNSCLGAFYLLWVLLRPFWYCKNSMQNGQKWWCKSSWYEVMSEFFATNVPDPHHWTLNSFFGAFLSVWVHLEPFRYCAKLAAKYAKLVQLMQKFVPWCLVRIYATNDLDPYHWTLNSCFGAFLSVWGHLEPFCYRMKLAAKLAKLVQLM